MIYIFFILYLLENTLIKGFSLEFQVKCQIKEFETAVLWGINNNLTNLYKHICHFSSSCSTA